MTNTQELEVTQELLNLLLRYNASVRTKDPTKEDLLTIVSSSVNNMKLILGGSSNIQN